MIYLYDKAIYEDLNESFNPDGIDNPGVVVVGAEEAVGLAAQIQNDAIRFPLVALTRKPDTPIDRDRMNFTRLHKGVNAVIEEETNNIYYEKAIPIDLRYVITVLTTNTVDMDEIVKELLFKYSDMYFLTMDLPYEAKRKVRFGIVIDPDSNLEKSSGLVEYIQSGQLYQTLIPLKVEGAVLVSYTAAHLKRNVTEVVATTRTQFDAVKRAENLI